MKQRVDPSFEYQRGPVLIGGAITFVVGVIVLFVLHRPAWLLPLSIVAGGIAGARGGFYDESANNGFVGVLVGVVFLVPFVFLYRFLAISGAESREETFFVGSVLAVADLIAYAPLMVVFGFVGGFIADTVRRQSNGLFAY